MIRSEFESSKNKVNTFSVLRTLSGKKKVLVFSVNRTYLKLTASSSCDLYACMTDFCCTFFRLVLTFYCLLQWKIWFRKSHIGIPGSHQTVDIIKPDLSFSCFKGFVVEVCCMCEKKRNMKIA